MYKGWRTLLFAVHYDNMSAIRIAITVYIVAAEKRADKVVKNSSPQFVEPFKDIMLSFFNKGMGSLIWSHCLLNNTDRQTHWLTTGEIISGHEEFEEQEENLKEAKTV